MSRTAVSPLERVKILFQLRSTSSSSGAGVFQTLRHIQRTEGIRGFFKGNGLNCLRIIPYSAVQFACYEQLKQVVLGGVITGRTGLRTWEQLSCGAVAGIASVVITYPLDIARTRLSLMHMSTSMSSNTNNSGKAILRQQQGLWSTLRGIYMNEGGMLAIYRGLSPTTLGVAPYVALNFTIYESIRGYYSENSNSEPTVEQKLFAGACAGK